jgi:hypothetical protein
MIGRFGPPRFLAAVVAAVILLPALARAQSTIAGTVRDTSGAVVPGVTVEAASPVLIERMRTALSDQGRHADNHPAAAHDPAQRADQVLTRAR